MIAASDTVPPADVPAERRDWSLWLGVLGTPVIWLIQFQTIYALVQWAGATGHAWVLPTIGGLAIVLILGCGWVCYRAWARAGKEWPQGTQPEALGRARTLAIVGSLEAVLFALATFAQALATFFIDPNIQ